MSFLLLILVVGSLIAVCIIGMSVGLLQNKTFRSCGCSSVTYKGEKIRCPGCTDTDEDEAPQVSCCTKSNA